MSAAQHTPGLTLEEQAHQYADAKRASYISKFKRGVKAGAADGVYIHAYGMFMRKATGQEGGRHG